MSEKNIEIIRLVIPAIISIATVFITNFFIEFRYWRKDKHNLLRESLDNLYSPLFLEIVNKNYYDVSVYVPGSTLKGIEIKNFEKIDNLF